MAFFLVGLAIVAWGQEKSPNRIVSEKLIGKTHPSSIADSFKVSPDSKRVAYGAIVGNKRFVVVDGKEEKQYDDILDGTPIFSPDSKGVAYDAGVGNNRFVVVDGNDGRQYSGIVKGGRITFDSPDSFHYLVLKDGGFYLVEERIE